MKVKVLKPIPGTGYSIGEEATFNEEGVKQFGEYLIEGNYIETIKEEKPAKPAKK